MSGRIVDHNGWFEVPANPLSKAGVFQYPGRSIDRNGEWNLEPNKLYSVYRSPETLSNPATMDSFRLLPFIDNHVMLGDKPGHVPAEIKGVHGVTGDKIWFNPADNILYGNLKVFSSSAPTQFAEGQKDVSLGYRCKYVKQSGIAFDGTPYDFMQINLLGNHGAYVKDGRCGKGVAVMDTLETLEIAFDAKDVIPMATLKTRAPKAYEAAIKMIAGRYAKHIKAPKADTFALDAAEEAAVASEPSLSDVAEMLADIMPTIADINSSVAGSGGVPDDMEAEMDATGQPVMDAATGKPKMRKKIKPAVAMDAAEIGVIVNAAVAKAVGALKLPEDFKVETLNAAMDAATAPLKTEIEQLKTGGIKGFIAELGKRDALVAKVTPFTGVFDSSDMTLNEVAKYATGKLLVPAMDGQELPAITAWLHGRAQPAKPAFTVGGTGMDSGRLLPGDKSAMDTWLNNGSSV